MVIYMAIFNTVIMVVKSKVYSVFSKVRVWLSPSYLRNKGIAKLRSCVAQLFDVKPRSREDYYPVLGWLVGKKLAYAVLLLVAVGSACYISSMLPEYMGEGYRTYKYNSAALKYTSGKVGILAADGRLAYVGEVEAGMAAGMGSLYDAQGNLVYEGEFEHSAYCGNGKRYYPNGILRYEGAFWENQFEGAGALYRENGTMEYEGDFSGDNKEGKGILYSSTENPVYTGTFQKGDIVYSELLGKSAVQAGAMYTGDTRVYGSGQSYCVAMPEIQALYCMDMDGNKLDEERSITDVYVLRPEICIQGTSYTNIGDITEAFGESAYEGNTAVSLKDAIAVNEACRERQILNGRVLVQGEAVFDDVYQVEEYDGSYLVYLYVFQIDDIVYTFYTTEKNNGFDMYSMEADE